MAKKAHHDKQAAPEAKQPAPAGETPPADPGVPVCPYHRKPCGAGRSDAFFTRYYCPEADCRFSAKVARPALAQRIARDRDGDQYSAR